jgi:hypothetical protein
MPGTCIENSAVPAQKRAQSADKIATPPEKSVSCGRASIRTTPPRARPRAARFFITTINRGCATIEVEDVVDDLHFEGDPATDSTRRQLERVLKDETPRRWPWLAAVAAGSTALMFWQVRRRRKNGASTNEPAPRRT